ncbi:hypothetical protein [Paracoccus sp. PAR01]|uniref:hypothetical protein n=1 Tax=Paracoccus sp. PAR01 TaxID=2769282 RepID=UPI001785B11F|nr:hypothetical protein [Paracoccus sp. PAR01]MBD9528404.1 hypothetical protein [Paracoccus sp. PAR01]
MSEFKLILAAHMRSMVARFGCLDAAAETINARFGASVSKGTISRKLSGSLDWSVLDVAAMEAALGAYPVTRLMDQVRVQAAISGTIPNTSSIAQAASISRESGEAVASILAAEQSNCAGDIVQAIKEIDDALAAMTASRAALVSILERASRA